MSRRRVRPRPRSRPVWARPAIPWAVLLLALGLSACASPPSGGDPARRRTPRAFLADRAFVSELDRSVRSPEEVERVATEHIHLDHFQGLLVRAGVAPSALPRDGRRLTPEEASRLLSQVLSAEVKLKDFGPWRMAGQLLWEVVQGGTPVARTRLQERMRGFNELLVLRPDGYLVQATTGRALQQAGEVRFERGALRAEGFEVGPFYARRSGFLYPVSGPALDIHPDAVLAGAYAPDEGTLGPTLEGAGQALMDSVSGIVSLVLHPGESLEALARLPETVRVLVESSPQFAAHFQSVSHGERVRIVSRLLTNVVLVCGTAGAGTARVASAGSTLGRLQVPVLSLSAQGVLALERVVVPAEHLAVAVSAAPGAFYILHMAGRGAGGNTSSWSPPPGGPGRWTPKKEGMKPRARQYQAQVTGTPEGWVYRVEHAGEHADFDGFQEGVLLEAKGPGYARFLDEDLEPLDFFQGFEELLETARRQQRLAQGTPIRWAVAEKRFADYLRAVFSSERQLTLEVVHLPARP